MCNVLLVTRQMKKSLSTILFLNSLVMSVCAQNILLDNGQNGTFLAAGIGKDVRRFTKELSVGYSFNGKLDLGFSAFHVKGKELGTHYIFSPSLSYLVLKQDRVPFSAEIFSNYQIKRYVRTTIIKDNSFVIGLGLYRKWRLFKNASLNPGIYFNRNFTRRSLDSYNEQLNTNKIGFESNFLINNLLISPGISSSQKHTVLSLKIGIIFRGADSIEPLNK